MIIQGQKTRSFIAPYHIQSSLIFLCNLLLCDSSLLRSFRLFFLIFRFPSPPSPWSPRYLIFPPRVNQRKHNKREDQSKEERTKDECPLTQTWKAYKLCNKKSTLIRQNTWKCRMVICCRHYHELTTTSRSFSSWMVNHFEDAFKLYGLLISFWN